MVSMPPEKPEDPIYWWKVGILVVIVIGCIIAIALIN